MAVEIRRIETAYAETPIGTPDRIDVTYEIGFTTPSGGWVKMAGVPEAVVQAAEDNAKAAKNPDTGPTDLSQPVAPLDDSAGQDAAPVEPEQGEADATPEAGQGAEPATVDLSAPAAGEAG